MSEPQPREAGGGPSPRGESGAPSDDESPDVPGLRTWRGVYIFVLGAFVATVIALTLFTRFYV